MTGTVTPLIHIHSYLAQGQSWMATLHEYVAEMLYLDLIVRYAANQTCTALNFSSLRFLRTDMAVILVFAQLTGCPSVSCMTRLGTTKVVDGLVRRRFLYHSNGIV